MKQQKCHSAARKEAAATARKNAWACGLAGVGLALNIAAAIIYGVGLPAKKGKKKKSQSQIRAEKLRRIKCPYRPYARHLLETGKKEY